MCIPGIISYKSITISVYTHIEKEPTANNHVSIPKPKTVNLKGHVWSFTLWLRHRQRQDYKKRRWL